MTETTPQGRWQTAPRPLNFVRVRLDRGGQAEYIREVLDDAKEDLYAELGDLRGNGKPEDDPEVVDVAKRLRFIIRALGDIEFGMIELAGPDGL